MLNRNEDIIAFFIKLINPLPMQIGPFSNIFIHFHPILKSKSLIKMCHFLFISILIFLINSIPAHKFELALFASSGCYSHDIMMLEIGQTFELILGANESTPQIHWVQIFAYDFDFGGQLPRPKQWKSVVVDWTDAREGDEDEEEMEAKEMQIYGHKLLWQMNVPFDHDRPWDLRGAYFFFHLLRWNNRLCHRFVRSPAFRHFLANTKIELVVVDHFIQECFEMAASLLNASITVQFSNWPIADGYITSFNLPAPPSAFPMTGTAYSPKDLSNFVVRLKNCVWHLVIMGARSIQANVVNQFYASIGHPEINLDQMEAKHLFYAGRAEFLVESIRPINNRIKHFGCAKCDTFMNVEENNLSLANKNRKLKLDERREMEGSLAKMKGSRILQQHCENQTSMMAAKMMMPFLILKSENCTKIEAKIGNEMSKTMNSMEKEGEWNRNGIDWNELEQTNFILVTFGSVAKVEFMPPKLFSIFLLTFSQSPNLVIWQTNSAVQKIINETKLPKNVRIVRWAPIKRILAHSRLRFSILHGGINTLNEALTFGKPILGLPLQGDQPSNLQRLVDLGMAELLNIRTVWEGQLRRKMDKIEANYAKYLGRAQKVSDMINFYRRELGGGQQNFWLNWAAKRRKMLNERGNRFFHLFYRANFEHFAVMQIGIAIFVVAILCAIISK